MGRESLHKLLEELIRQEGSDLHIKVGSPPKVRVNGVLRAIPDMGSPTPVDTATMAASVMSETIRRQFEESNDADFAYAWADVGRFRVNAFRQRGSVAMVFRHVSTSAVSLEDLGLPPVVETLADEHRGLVLVTGPTGSGKTTTLAGVIDHINKTRECHIITIEDPIEVLHRDARASINQREIGVDTGSFARAMRGAMRQDPDVILVGEMRDEETVRAALSAAETGHLVLSTLHTIDATETISRIVDFFPPHQQSQARHSLAGTLRGTVCQRLVPTIDGDGRVAALEVMVVNGRIQQCIVDPEQTAGLEEIIADGEFYGMRTFDQSLADLYGAAKIDLNHAMASASKPHDLKVELQLRGFLDSNGNIIEGSLESASDEAAEQSHANSDLLDHLAALQPRPA